MRWVFILLALGLLQFTAAAELSVSPSFVEGNISGTFSVGIIGNAPAGGSDFYATEFDVNYNSSVIVLDSVSSGNLSASGVSNYEVVANSFHGYYFLNFSEGFYGSGSLFVLNFQAVGAGTSDITLDNVIWVNSTITNDSAVTISPLLTEGFVNISSISNGTVIVAFCGDGTCNSGEDCNSCSADCGVCPSGDSGSGGGGGGGGGGAGIPIRPSAVNNSTSQPNTGEVEFGLQEGNNENTGEEGIIDSESSNNEELNRGARPSITGRIVDNLIGEGGILKSWAFWFVMALVILGGVLFFLKIGRKKVSKY